MTNERITYTATMPDGTTDTRTSPTMEYTHAVIGEHPVHGWIACSWHTSFPLALKGLNSRYTSSTKRRVVEVTGEPATKKGREAKAAREAAERAEAAEQAKAQAEADARARIDAELHYCGLCGERTAHPVGECTVTLPRYIETGSFTSEPSSAFVEAQKEAEASIAEETDLDVLVALVDSGRPSVREAARARWAVLAEQHAAVWTEARQERARISRLLDQALDAESAARRALEAFAAHGMRTFPEA